MQREPSFMRQRVLDQICRVDLHDGIREKAVPIETCGLLIYRSGALAIPKAPRSSTAPRAARRGRNHGIHSVRHP